MNLIQITEHSLLTLPKEGSKVLDVGCRSFTFADAMVKLGCEVWAIEPDIIVKEPSDANIHLIRTALVDSAHANKEKNLIKWSSGEGNYLEDPNRSQPESSCKQITTCSSILQINAIAGVWVWDVVKMDCEGAEYEILLDWPGPIAKQITVEFHDFTGANPGGQETYNKMFKHLKQWYEIIQHKWGAKPGQKTQNYWDSLFVLRE